MTAFTQKKLSNNKSFPEIIKNQRLKNNLSLEELSLKIQISINYLEILEKGQYNKLPGEVYAKQFIKKLAKFFHLNEKCLLKIFTEEHNRQLSFIKKLPSQKQYLNAGLLSPRFIRNGFIVIIIIGFLGYFGFEIKNIFTPPGLEIYSPASQTITTESSIKIEGKTEPESTVLINQQEILTGLDGGFSEVVDLSIGVNTFNVSAGKKHSKFNSYSISILRKPSSTAEINLNNISNSLSDSRLTESIR